MLMRSISLMRIVMPMRGSITTIRNDDDEKHEAYERLKAYERHDT